MLVWPGGSGPFGGGSAITTAGRLEASDDTDGIASTIYAVVDLFSDVCHPGLLFRSGEQWASRVGGFILRFLPGESDSHPVIYGLKVSHGV